MNEQRLVGSISPLGVLSGHVSGFGALSGTAVIATGVAKYTGDYTATPETYNEVIMPTKGYLMGDNVTVQKIPQFEVSNDAGGSTLIIGEEYFKHG